MRPGKTKRFYCCVLLLLWTGWSLAQDRLSDELILKPATDTREYRYRRLDNGLQLLLIRDATVESWRLAVDVAAGTNQEAPQPAGTANLLAHSLLPARPHLQSLLTEYPVKTRVTAEHSRFELTLPASVEGKQGIMSEVWQALLYPEFTEQALSHALVHMDQAFQHALGSDVRRRMDVYCALYQADHPLARHCSADERVEQLDAESLPELLLAYHQRHYVPQQMTLVLVTPEPLSSLQVWLAERLKGLPAAELPDPVPPVALLADNSLPLGVDIRSADGKPRLFLSFPVPPVAQHAADQPFSLASALLENDGPGGLLWLLQDLGWGESVQTRLRTLSRHQQLYEVAIELTDLGVRARDQLVALVFYQLGQIRERGIEAWRYQELAQLAELDFRYAPVTEVNIGALAERLHYREPAQVLHAPYQYAPFNAEVHRRYLGYLTSDNVIIAYSGRQVEATLLSPLLAAPYTRSALTPEQPAIKISVRRKLAFPGENSFIPKRLNVKDEQLLPTPSTRINTASEPVKIKEKPRFQAWYQQDVIFREPRASIYIRVDSPLALASVEAAASTRLLAVLLERQLRANVHQARAAGFEFTLRAQPQGLMLSLTGYSSQQGLMLTKVGQVLNDLRFDEEAFTQARRRLQKELQAQPDTVQTQIAAQLVSPYWSPAQQLEALKTLEYKSFNRFAQQFFNGIFIRSFYYGNLYRQEAQRLATLTEHYLSRPGSEGLPRQQLRPAANQSESDEAWSLPLMAPSPPAVHYYVQAHENTPEARAQLALLADWLPHFWRPQLPQTDETVQLQVRSLNLLDYPGVLISLSALRTDTQTLRGWLQQLLARQWPENAWQARAQQLHAQWQQAPVSQRQQAQRLWQFIDRRQAGQYDLSARTQALAQLDDVALRTTYRQVFLSASGGLWLLGPDSALPSASDALEMMPLSAYSTP